MLPAPDDLIDGFALYAERRHREADCNAQAVFLAAEQARAVGLELSFVPVELDIHALRILRGEMTFLELRGWFAARLAPIERRPWPPKRR